MSPKFSKTLCRMMQDEGIDISDSPLIFRIEEERMKHLLKNKVIPTIDEILIIGYNSNLGVDRLLAICMEDAHNRIPVDYQVPKRPLNDKRCDHKNHACYCLAA